MDVIMRRCPFLARMPQAFLQQSKKTLVTYAQQCPIMMELAAKPMAPSMARALCSSSSSYQKPENTVSAGEGDKDGGHTGYSNQHYSCVIFSQINHVIIELLINVKFTFFPLQPPKRRWSPSCQLATLCHLRDRWRPPNALSWLLRWARRTVA